MVIRPLLALLCVAATPFAVAATSSGDPAQAGAGLSSDACGDGGNRQQLICLSTRIDRLRAELDGAYRDALAKLPEVDDQDRRGGREQLRQSETAWLQYEQANCPLVGALQGGSSSWITHFAAICEAQEIQARTRVLRQIGDGTFGNH